MGTPMYGCDWTHLYKLPIRNFEMVAATEKLTLSPVRSIVKD